MRSLRITALVAVIAGVALTAAGAATVSGLLPYFTIQSNVAYGLFAGWAAFRGPIDRPALKGAVTLYVAITGLVYHLVLANPASGFSMGPVERTPAEAVGNQLLHTVVPLLAVLDWLIFDERRRFRWRYAAYWLAFPLGYLGFALIRGLITHTYPYPFIDVTGLGYAGVSLSALFFAVAFWVLGLAFVAVDRLPRRTAAGERDPVS
ncbi:Pr6Pr family membrane protein [Couchioplanes caeruleus]|uniref:Pr6Pr family membrane protein n=1 Tax=Couchioplanes caeruleus TaxID=56438 RepID=UPI00201C5297|nr:Pr6Pr family membrane protein [Couchioplanes caeruleus]UQU66098.1 Pr6Pr family membrane protein [Couchioplanes caeruleus]